MSQNNGFEADDDEVLEVSRLFAKWFIEKTKNQDSENEGELIELASSLHITSNSKDTSTLENNENKVNEDNNNVDNENTNEIIINHNTNVEKKVKQQRQLLKLTNKLNNTKVVDKSNKITCFDFSELLGMVNDMEKQHLKNLNQKLIEASKIIDNQNGSKKTKKRKKRNKNNKNKNNNEIGIDKNDNNDNNNKSKSKDNEDNQNNNNTKNSKKKNKNKNNNDNGIDIDVDKNGTNDTKKNKKQQNNNNININNVNRSNSHDSALFKKDNKEKERQLSSIIYEHFCQSRGLVSKIKNLRMKKRNQRRKQTIRKTKKVNYDSRLQKKLVQNARKKRLRRQALNAW